VAWCWWIELVVIFALFDALVNIICPNKGGFEVCRLKINDHHIAALFGQFDFGAPIFNERSPF
jgi:hypothetical protein